MVWEFAMLPEMFCSANDCACRPDTAVVNASKIPMTLPLQLDPQRHALGPRRMAQRRASPSNPRAIELIMIFQCVMRGDAIVPGAGYADLPADIAELHVWRFASASTEAPCDSQVCRVLIRRNHRKNPHAL